jgi:two-component system LytT family sensor kinase
MNSERTKRTLFDWRSLRFWVLVWLGGTIMMVGVLLWDASPWLLGASAAGFRETKLNAWPLEMLWWPLVPAVFWLQQKLPIADRRWAWALGLHGLAAVLITGLFTFLSAARMILVDHLPMSFLPVVVDDLRETGAIWGYTPALIYLLLVCALYAVGFYRQWRAGLQLTGELQVANAQLETKLVRASLDALKMQLHPHFLFNTLNTITSLIRTGRTREAEDIVAGLGELLRRSLDHRQGARETLEHELVFLHRYLEIESIRFQDRLKVEFNIDPDCQGALVPSLMLQPLVENAMKHGISKDPAARLLRISVTRDGPRLVMSVYNDGPALPADGSALNDGIGVNNTLSRLQMLYGAEGRLRLLDQPPHGVRAEIVLPFQTTLP